MYLVTKVIVGSDHAGFALKQKVIEHLRAAGLEVQDVGTYSEASCDYPLIAHSLCTDLQAGRHELGILICGTGVGISIAANKHRGIRAACVSDTFSARMTRQHNNANVLCFGARVVGEGIAMELVDQFLSTPFEGGRHQRRLDLLTSIEEGKFE